MALTGTDIQVLASGIAKDPDNEVWGTDKMLRYINEAQQAVCLLRPDASIERRTIPLVAGTIQTITGRRLLKILNSNGAADGSNPLSAPHVVEYDDFMRTYDQWVADTSGSEIDDYAYDERDPTRFYITPGSDGVNRYAEILQAIVPTNLTALTNGLSVSDIYAPPMAEWVLWRVFGEDSEVTPNHQRAINHAKNFYGLLQRKAPADLGITPNLESIREAQEQR